MIERYYTLATYTTEQWQEIHDELCTSDATPDTIPDRACTCTDDMIHSAVRGEFLLTEQEAQTLASDSRIKFINKSFNRYPELMPPEDKLHNGILGTVKTERWATPNLNYMTWTDYQEADQFGGGTYVVTTQFSTEQPTVNRASYQFVRMQSKEYYWKDQAFAPYPTQKPSPKWGASEKVRQFGAGEHTDVICADNGSWIGHTEFINSGVTNAVNPSDYTGGNVLPGDGYCDVLDLVLDAPYYIDPDWFDASPGTRLTTRWDGTTVPVESIARSWWQYTQERSAQFAAFGSIIVPSWYTRDNAHGSPTTLPSSANHGTQCASLLYGRTHGWAYNSNKWQINLYGANNIGSFERGFDIQKIFHQYKPINPLYGTKDPTISSNSWGYRSGGSDDYDPGYSDKTGDYWYWRTDPAVSYDGLSWEPRFIYRNGLKGDAGRWASEMYDNSMTQAGDELIQAGVIFVTSGGNSNQQVVNPDHPNYDNRISNNNTNTLYQDSFYEFGVQTTGTTNRRGFPMHIGKTESQTFQGNTTVKFPAINVGALSDRNAMQYPFVRIEHKIDYSNTGPAIDFYAPGDGTLAATVASQGVIQRLDDTYSDLTVYSGNCYDARFSGTSAAAPVAAGLLASVMQYNRGWTWEDLKNWIQTNVELQPADSFNQGTEPTTPNDTDWTQADHAYESLLGGDPRVLYQATIPVSTPYPGVSDTEIQGSFTLSGGVNFSIL